MMYTYLASDPVLCKLIIIFKSACSFQKKKKKKVTILFRHADRFTIICLHLRAERIVINTTSTVIYQLLCNYLHVGSLQKVDTTLLGLSPEDAAKSPYIASMGVYVFKKDILLKLLGWRYPTSNDFGSEIIPSAVTEHNVQVCILDLCVHLHLVLC